jgi:hypothetical protein
MQNVAPKEREDMASLAWITKSYHGGAGSAGESDNRAAAEDLNGKIE